MFYENGWNFIQPSEILRKKKENFLSSPKQKYIILTTVTGSTLEWFEFSLFGLMAPFFIYVFFPPSLHNSPWLFPLLMILSVIARPLGGMIFGEVGDHQGRKPALSKTISFLIIPLVLTAWVPSYNEAGNFSFYLLSFIFIAQGFIMGGEFPGSVVYLVESAQNHHKSHIGSWAYFGCFAGMFLAGVEIFILQILTGFHHTNILTWRYSFLSTACIAVIVLIARHFLPETSAFKNIKKHHHIDKKSVFDTFHKYKKPLLCGIGLVALESVGINILVLFSAPLLYLHSNLGIFEIGILELSTVFVLMLTIPISGKLSTRYGNIKVAKFSIYGLIISLIPLYYLISLNLFLITILSHAIQAFFVASYLGTIPSLLCSLFPAELRYSGVAAAMNLSVCIFSSIGIVSIVFFLQYNLLISGPFFYWIGGCVFSLWALTYLNKHLHQTT